MSDVSQRVIGVHGTEDDWTKSSGQNSKVKRRGNRWCTFGEITITVIINRKGCREVGREVGKLI